MSSAVRHATSHSEALARLRAGNQRYVQNLRSVEALASHAKRAELASGQSPFAIILSCSDSRVPSELVFDSGLGDLFVVRVAGNVVAPSILGSIEFAAATFGSELVLVMGHTHCGAVTATIESLTKGTAAVTESIGDIVARIEPAVVDLLRPSTRTDSLVFAATRANVRASVRQIERGSALLARRIAEGRLVVLGAEYSLATGEVDFFDRC